MSRLDASTQERKSRVRHRLRGRGNQHDQGTNVTIHGDPKKQASSRTRTGSLHEANFIWMVLGLA